MRGIRKEHVAAVFLLDNVEYGKIWGDKYYRIKQVAPVVAEEDDRIVVVTVYTFFF